MAPTSTRSRGAVAQSFPHGTTTTSAKDANFRRAVRTAFNKAGDACCTIRATLGPSTRLQVFVTASERQ